jgi:hypothetical protein
MRGDEQTTEVKEGWGWPLNSRKAHYFTHEGRSLCGNWMFFGQLQPDDFRSKDDCKACLKRLAKSREGRKAT